MRTIAVVGAGFSGLTLAFELRRLGFDVHVIERQKRAGGLLSTRTTPNGLVESAANAMLSNSDVEDMFVELRLPFAERKPERKKRYIFWDEPKRWPLAAASTLRLMWMGARVAMGFNDVFPRAGESVHKWTQRTMDRDCEERLIEPALAGVFAGDTSRLSAPLTLGALFKSGGKAGYYKGSVAPEKGMGQLVDHLADYLQSVGVAIDYGRDYKLRKFITEPTVLCTSAWGASEILAGTDDRISELLKECESLPLVSATCFFPSSDSDLQGFGCLFPRVQQFASSGVLFNSSIFEGRSPMRSETWILGGATRPEVVTWSDDQIVASVVKDRQRLSGRYEEPSTVEITRWPRAIPHYTVAWEKILREIKPKPPLFLHGNYLGALGLSRIYARSKELARQIKEMYP